MQYRLDERSGNKLSVLGFGCMRLSRGATGIDQKKAERLILRAIDKGVNYFDTAYLYPGAEAALGTVLARNGVREKVYVATKIPFSHCKARADFDKYLTAQLAALCTDYIDYYLMHNINTVAQWEALCELGVLEWIAEMKAAGSIRQVGFSFHGAKAEFPKLLTAYDWDFCQIQLNYANESYQAGLDGLKLAGERRVPVMIMEPLLGGKLANGLAPSAASAFRRVHATRSAAAWGLRWLWNRPEVTVVLSGMNEVTQLDDNASAAEAAEPWCLTEAELRAYEEVVEVFKRTDKVPCTGCSYCMPCPVGVNIPACFASYNASYTHGRIASYTMYITSTAANRVKNSRASNCVKCGKCEAHCPQDIAIRKELGNVTRRMEPPYLRAGLAVMRRRKARRDKR